MPAVFDRIDAKNLDDVNRIQDNIITAFQRLMANPLAGVSLVENVVLGTTAVAVRHGLGQPIRGWFVVKANAGVSIYTTSEHSDPTEFVNLTAAATVTMSLLFF